MQLLQKFQSHIKPICQSLNDFIADKTGIDIDLHEHCSFTEQVNDFGLEIIIGGVVILLAAIIFLALKISNSKSKTFLAELVDIKVISHDTKIFTFDLPEGTNQIGLNIGEHLELEAEIKGEIVARKYTPISRADVKRNSFELLIKVYYKQAPQWPNGGLMSQYVNDMRLGDKIKVTLPYGRFNYLGKSNVQIKELNGTVRKQKVDHIYMVGGGTGITPLYQVIQYVTEAEAESERPALTLLFANRTEDDILVKQELENFEQQNSTFKCHFSVDKSIKEGWKGFTGYIDEEKISKILGPNLENSLFAVCGPPVLCNIVQKVLTTKFNVKPSQFFRF